MIRQRETYHRSLLFCLPEKIGRLENWKITFQSSNLPIFQSQLFFTFGLEFNDFNAQVVAACRADLMG